MDNGMRIDLLRPIIALLVPIALTVTCGKESTAPRVPAALVKVSGDGQSGTANTALAAPLVVKVTDASGGAMPAVSVTWTVRDSAGSDVRSSITDAAGLGQLTLTLDTLAGPYTVTATVAQLTPVVFTATCLPGPAAKLVFLVQPSSVGALSSINPAIQVGVRDAWSNIVASGSLSIQVWITAGTGTSGATLSGSNIQGSVGGVATFDQLTIDKAGAAYTLTALCAGVTAAVSAPFSVTPGSPKGLAFGPPPSSGPVDRALPAFAVRILDAAGNLVTSAQDDVSVHLSQGVGPASSTLAGATLVRASGGVATFAATSVDTIGDYSLTATAGGLDSATSQVFHVGPGAASRLSFLDQPGSVVAWDTMLAPVRVSVLDRFGNVTDSIVAVTVAIAAGTGTAGARLLGTTTRSSNGGIASFGNLRLDKAGVGYRLAASGPRLGTATSDTFRVTAAPPRLAFVGQPGTVAMGATMTPAVAVAVQDPGGTTLTDSIVSITVAIAPGTGAPGAGLAGTTTVVTDSGVARFADLHVDKIGIGYVLTATAADANGVSSDSFLVRGTALDYAAGAYHGCARAVGGQTLCFGMDNSGQLGGGRVDTGWASVAGGVSFAQIAAGYFHTCGLTGSGQAYCWGDNGLARIGDGTSVNSSVPVPVAGGHVFRQITASADHTCALEVGGEAWCWGLGGLGQLGTGDSVDVNVPVLVAGGLSFTQLTAGLRFTCGLLSGGQAYCWGVNTFGQLGDSSTTTRRVPGPVAGGLAFTRLSAGNEHACGLTTGGATACWGHNDGGQLGVGDTLSRTAPAAVASAVPFATVAAGGRHTCALTAAGVPYCWGANEVGQVGDGSTVARSRPVPVSGGLVFTLLGVAWEGACGLTTDGRIYCWGYNFFGKILSSGTSYVLVPSGLGVF